MTEKDIEEAIGLMGYAGKEAEQMKTAVMKFARRKSVFCPSSVSTADIAAVSLIFDGLNAMCRKERK